MALPPTASSPRFFCYVKDQAVGPYHVVELAELLRYSTIDGNTPICREHEENWQPFHELPEYAAAQGIPIEQIARQAPAPADTSPDPSKSSSVPWLVFAGAAFFLVVIGLAYVFSPSSVPGPLPHPAGPTPPPASWVLTKENYFSVLCPVALKKTDAAKTSRSSHYTGQFHSTTFKVIEIPLGPYTNAHDLGQRLTDTLLERSDSRTTTEQEIPSPKYHIHDFTFKTPRRFGPDELSRLRLVESKFEFYCLFVSPIEGDVSDQDATRFFDSLQAY